MNSEAKHIVPACCLHVRAVSGKILHLKWTCRHVASWLTSAIMQNTSLCILNCVWISIYVSAFLLHCFKTFYNSRKYMLILKTNHQTPHIILHFRFFIQCWVSSYKHFCGWAKSFCCSLRDLFLILPALWTKPLLQPGKDPAADIDLCARYQVISNQCGMGNRGVI